MKLKLLNFNDSRKNYEYDLSAINKKMWECLISEVVIMDCSNLDDVSSAQAKVSIRDNLAKMKIAYYDGINHELRYFLSPTEIEGEYKEELSKTWSDIVSSIRKKVNTDTIQAENNFI